MTLTPLEAAKTRMRVASLGYGTDDEALAMRRYFERGNQATIETIRRHFAGQANAH